MPASSASVPSRAVDEIVDIALHRADMILEARAFGGEAREDEAAIFADARRAREAEPRLVEIGRATFRHPHGGETAFGVEAPAAIAAGQPPPSAPALIPPPSAAMGAAAEH